MNQEKNNGNEGWFIKHCKEDIIKKYTGNNLLKFTNADFEKLSDDIFESTKISISVSTLKRIWKEDYKGSPSLSTLDALAKYLGFRNWRNYCNECHSKHAKGFIFLRQKVIRYQKMLFYISGIILSVSILVFLFFKSNRFYKPDYDDVEFTFKEFDSTQMPAIAIFKYDLKGIKCDSVTIRPIGNCEDEFSVSVNDSIATYTYIRPWQYNPTLTIDGKAVKSLKTNFVTGRWKAGLSNTSNVFYIKYFDDAEIYRNGKLSFSKDLLIRKNFLLDNIDYVTYDLFKRFDNIYGDSLHFETRIKNTILVREEYCGNINISLCFQQGFILVPFSIEKSPYATLSATFFENNISSRNNSLSFIYLDIEEWNTIKIITSDKQIDLYTNDSIVFSTKYNLKPGKLTGIMFDFKGLGEVDFVRFYNPGNVLVYSDEFE